MLGGLILLLLAPDPAVAEAEAKARAAVRANNIAEALVYFEAAIRAAEDTPTKARLREAYLAAGWAEPPPTNLAETNVINTHIRNEKLRVFGTKAAALQGRGKYHAAILVRRALMELAGKDSGRAKQEANAIKRIIRALTERPTAGDKELVAKLLRARRVGRNLIKAARKLLAQRRYRVVVRLCQEMMFGSYDQKVKNQAIELRQEAERTASADASPEESVLAKQALSDARFGRLSVSRSRHFLFIGPKTFVSRIPARQRLMLDLAYIFQSDLAQQHLTFNGVRICIYYQETFDFGGGLAGGKLIRIGNRAIRLPIAGMLHYHELGHCIFGRGWLHHGFTEGLADFAAGFTLDALGQTAGAQSFIVRARDQFVRYFLGRDVRYFDIQPYKPSAGFLFSFLPPGEAPFNWAPYRRSFHRMREAQFGSWPARQHQIMRYFGYLMATEYGASVFDTLAEWGWPVERVDFLRVPPEAASLLSQAKQGDFKLMKGSPALAEPHYRRVLAAQPDGPLSHRARFGLLRVAIARGDAGAAATLKRRLGILDDFKVLGPYHARRQTAFVVLPPETHIDHRKPVRVGYETAKWKRAKVRPSGFVDLRKQGYGYPEHACAFALTYVFTDAGGPARVWVGSDDGHTLLVNNQLVEKRPTARGFTFDDDFADVTLRRGWNRLLLKVHNSAGGWGFLMRVTRRDGSPIPDLRHGSADLEAAVPPDPVGKLKAVPIVAEEFRGLSSQRWLQAVGSFDTSSGRLRPLGTANLGLWQRFVVTPDRPRNGPANLMWLRSPALARADHLELEMVVAATGADGLPARFGFTVDGENENDGQSGHTFVLSGSDRKLACTWYRYDRLLYLQQGVEIPKAAKYRLRLRRVGTKWWLTVNDVALFDAVDAPRLPAFGFGIMTWGRGPLFESLRLSRLAPR